MKCPECGQELVCGCAACLVNFPAKENKAHMLFTPDGNCEKCPNCGYTDSCDGWLDIELDQLKAEGKWPIIIKNESTLSKENK